MPSPDKELSYGPVTFTVAEKAQTKRLDQYLQSRLSSYSRSRLQTLIRQGAVTVNGEPAKPSHKLSARDVVLLELPEDHPRRIEPEDIPLNVLYEDEQMAAVNKPPGMVVHPARGNWTGTLVNALLHHCSSLSATSDPGRPGIVHRLDQYTSGVIVCAKTDEAFYRLGSQFELRTTRKEYLAITDGEPESDRGEIDSPLGADPRDRLKVAVRLMGGKRALTHYVVEERFGGHAFVHLRPRTGRTHQLRVHLASVGCPVLADALYSDRSEFSPSDAGQDGDEPVLTRQALHAWRLTLDHPRSGKSMSFEAPLPDDMAEVLRVLRAG